MDLDFRDYVLTALTVASFIFGVVTIAWTHVRRKQERDVFFYQGAFGWCRYEHRIHECGHWGENEMKLETWARGLQIFGPTALVCSSLLVVACVFTLFFQRHLKLIQHVQFFGQVLYLVLLLGSVICMFVGIVGNWQLGGSFASVFIAGVLTGVAVPLSWALRKESLEDAVVTKQATDELEMTPMIALSTNDHPWYY